MVTVDTKLISLLGYPLKQTFAPEMFNRTFEELGMDYFYFPIETETDNLRTIVSAIRCMNYAGFNSTKPNKTAIMQYLDELDDLAETIGSVNVVTIRDGMLKGYNTDGSGFVQAFRDERGDTLGSDSFLILGAGGASRAISTTLAFEGAKELVIVDQYDEASESLVESINSKVRKCARFVPFNDAPMGNLLRQADVLVNATGIGMPPHVERTPVDKTLLHENLFVVDITYNPPRTQLLLDAQEKGCAVMNGIGMAINQGIKGFALMTGEPEPAEIMTRVTREIVASRQGGAS